MRPRLIAGSVIDCVQAWRAALARRDHRKPAQLDGEKEQQDDGRDKGGKGKPGQRGDPHDIIDEAVAPHRRPDAERHAERDAERERDQGQVDGPRQNVEHFGEHRLTGDHGDAPVAAQSIAEEARILQRDGLIEAEPDMQRFDRLARGLVAEDELRRIARQDAHDHEDEGEHREQRHERRDAVRRMRKAVMADQFSSPPRDGAAQFRKCVFSVTGGARLSEPFRS